MGILFFIFLFSREIIGKYLEQKAIAGEANIATPIFIVEGEQNIVLDNVHPKKDYAFKIKNYTEEKINDTAFCYTIYLQTNLEDKMNFQLEKEGVMIPLKGNSTQGILMGAGEKLEHNYQLTLETKEEASEVMGNITIKVLAEQMQ